MSNVGAIAGTMHNTKLENVEVNKFEIKDGRRAVALGAQSNLGGVARASLMAIPN